MAQNTSPAQGPQASPEAALLRINKALADAGVCSRRAADELVAAGAVTVNGQTVTSPGLRIDPATDVVELRGQRVAVPVPGARAHTLVLLNKPTGVVTTASDPQGRTTVLDLLGEAFGPARLYPVGRLDYFSQGLLLLTDHGELANRLTHPRWHLPKVYEVLVRGTVPPATLALFSRGMTLADGQALAPAPTRVLGVASRATSLEMTLTQGVNRQIRRMCEQAGLTILRLTRVALGPLRLGDLPEGQARALTPDEAAALLRAVGLGPAPKDTPRAPAPGKPRTPAPAGAPGRTAKAQPGGGASRGPRRRG